MTASATVRMTDMSAPVPTLGTLSAAANSLYLKGTLVSRDANGRAAVPVDDDGLDVAGVARHTLDNRTGSELGGAADAANLDLDFGVGGFAFTGATPKFGDLLYVVDNQTVSVDSHGDARGVAGVCVQVDGSTVYVFVGPLTQLLASIVARLVALEGA